MGNNLLSSCIRQQSCLANIAIAAEYEESIRPLLSERFAYLYADAYQQIYMQFLTNNVEVSLPVIFQNTDRSFEDRKDFFIDPPFNGIAVNINQYLGYRRRFFHLQFISGGRRANEFIHRTLQNASMTYGQNQLIDFLDRLYANQWILGAALASEWKITLLCMGNMERVNQLQNDTSYILSLGEDFKKRLDVAKQVSVNLDEWFYALFCLMPDLFTIARLTSESSNDELQKLNKYLDEVQADAYTTLSICSSAILKGNKTPLSDIYLKMKDEPPFMRKSGRELIRHVRYHYSARTILPKFWYEAAKQTVETESSELPGILDSYNHLLICGLSIAVCSPDELFLMFA